MVRDFWFVPSDSCLAAYATLTPEARRLFSSTLHASLDTLHSRGPVGRVLASRLAGGYDDRMTTGTNIREKLAREPFQPFRILITSGDTFIVRNPALVVVMRSELFIARPNSDRHAFIPLLHVAAVETLGNGRRRKK